MCASRLDTSTAATLLDSLRELLPYHLKGPDNITTHMPLLVVKLLPGISMHGAFESCVTPGDADVLIDSLERRDSVRGIADAFSARAIEQANGHSKECDALVVHQSAPGGGCVQLLPLAYIYLYALAECVLQVARQLFLRCWHSFR